MNQLEQTCSPQQMLKIQQVVELCQEERKQVTLVKQAISDLDKIRWKIRKLLNGTQANVPWTERFTVLKLNMLLLAMFLAGCSTPTTNQPPTSSPVVVEPPFIPEVPVKRTPNITPSLARFSQIPQANLAPAAAPVEPPKTNILATWDYRPNESLMVIHSKTNLKGAWVYRTNTTNTSIKFPANKQQEWFWFWPIQRGGSFHYGSGYVLAPR